MRKLLTAATLAASIPLAPLAHAAPSQGDSCVNWHATTQGANGQTLVCTHLPDSGHMMYWESSIQDRSYRTSGFKTGPNDDWYGFGSGHPCNSNDVPAPDMYVSATLSANGQLVGPTAMTRGDDPHTVSAWAAGMGAAKAAAIRAAAARVFIWRFLS